jgi:hypothetical protein
MSYFPNQGQTTSDRSQSIVPASDSPQFPTGNVTKKYRTNCDALPLAQDWTTTLGDGDLLLLDGNCQGASYWVLSKSPFNVGTESVIDGLQTFKMPIEASFALHRSQAVLNQEFAMQIVDSAAPSAAPAEVAISALSQTTTTLTVTTSASHNLSAGQSVGIYGCADSRFNYGALVVASVLSATQFTATAGPGGNIQSLTASPAALGSPMLYVRRRLGGSTDGTSMIFENATATSASFYVRAASGDSVASGTATGNQSITAATTASVQPINAVGAYSFFPSSKYNLNLQADRVQWHDGAIDSIAATTSRVIRDSICPDPDKLYKARIVATNNKGLTAPVGKIVSAVKTASTSATVTFAAPHGLTVDDYLVGYGVSNQAAAAFANLTTAAKVSSIVSPTAITIVWGSSGTATAYGGYMSRVNGGAAQNGAIAQVFQSVSISSGILTVTGNTTWAGLVNGDLVDIYGVRSSVNGSDLGIDGVYKVKSLVTSTLTLETVTGGPSPANLVSTNCGGGVIKRSDFRISAIRIFEYIRERVEFAPRPSTDAVAAIQANVAGGSINASTIASAVPSLGVSSGSTNSTLAVSIGSGISQVDHNATAFAGLGRVAGTVVASARGGASVVCAEVSVTALTLGTATAVYFILQESTGGANYTDVWVSDRITASGGVYRVPPVPIAGRRRWTCLNIGGTSTTVTATITTIELPPGAYALVRDFKDVTGMTTVFNNVTSSASTFSDLVTLNNATAPCLIEGCKLITAFFSVSGTPTGITTAPVVTLEASLGTGGGWQALGTVTVNAAGGFAITAQNFAYRFARLRVSTALAAGSGTYNVQAATNIYATN